MNTIELEEEEEEFFSARSSLSSSSSQEFFLSSSPTATEDPSSQSVVESSQFRLTHVEEKNSGDGRKVIVMRSCSSVSSI